MAESLGKAKGIRTVSVKYNISQEVPLLTACNHSPSLPNKSQLLGHEQHARTDWNDVISALILTRKLEQR